MALEVWVVLEASGVLEVIPLEELVVTLWELMVVWVVLKNLRLAPGAFPLGESLYSLSSETL